MKLGRFASLPFRLGGGEPLSRKIYRGLNAQMGTAYDTSEESTVTAETSAEARLIAAAWHANERAANQLDFERVTDFVPRWEAILNLHPSHSDSMASRRARIAAKRTAVGTPTELAVATLCDAVLGAVFVGLEFTPLSRAAIEWPGNGYPDTWYSTTAHVLVRVTQPAGVTDADFLGRCNGMIDLLKDFLPDWCTADWAILNSDDEEGFILDDPTNLDTETFD
jgi:hypothetical protein